LVPSRNKKRFITETHPKELYFCLVKTRIRLEAYFTKDVGFPFVAIPLHSVEARDELNSTALCRCYADLTVPTGAPGKGTCTLISPYVRIKRRAIWRIKSTHGHDDLSRGRERNSLDRRAMHQDTSSTFPGLHGTCRSEEMEDVSYSRAELEA
jgi:hypothetical protein